MNFLASLKGLDFYLFEKLKAFLFLLDFWCIYFMYNFTLSTTCILCPMYLCCILMYFAWGCPLGLDIYVVINILLDYICQRTLVGTCSHQVLWGWLIQNLILEDIHPIATMNRMIQRTRFSQASKGEANQSYSPRECPHATFHGEHSSIKIQLMEESCNGTC